MPLQHVHPLPTGHGRPHPPQFAGSVAKHTRTPAHGHGVTGHAGGASTGAGTSGVKVSVRVSVGGASCTATSTPTTSRATGASGAAASSHTRQHPSEHARHVRGSQGAHTRASAVGVVSVPSATATAASSGGAPSGVVLGVGPQARARRATATGARAVRDMVPFWPFAAPMATLPDFGTDIDAVDDLDPHMVLVSGLTNLAHACARRLGVERGTLSYDPDYGYDLRDLASESFSAQSLYSMRHGVIEELQKDERVGAAHVDIVASDDAYRLRLTILVETAEGAFRLVLGVSSLTVDLLESSV